MTEVNLFIDGMEIKAEKGRTILETALANNIYIPHLCYHPDLSPFGGCRLCIVEIERRGLTISCRTQVEEGMKVITESEEIDKLRRIAVELLIVNHHADCLSCAKNLECKLQEVARYIGIDEERLKRLRRTERALPLDTSNPFFIRDPNRCVLCGICVRTCSEIQGVNAIDFTFRGFATIISTYGNEPIAKSICESCGECVVRCPVGALIPKDTQKPTREVKSICPYCGCGCGIYLGVRGNRVVSVKGNPNSPVNGGMLCVKGRFGYKFLHHPDRLTLPLIKQNGRFVEVSWDEALSFVAQKLNNYKGNEFAAIASAKCSNEDNYILQKFTRVVMKTNNIDLCARLCHAPSVVGLLKVIGSGAMSNSMSDIEGASCIIAIGTNTTEAHPIAGLWVKKAVKRGAKLIVINPKRIDLCRFADIFLQHRPGSDVALIMGMCYVIVKEELCDIDFIKERCEGFEEFKESLKNFSLEEVEKITGVEKEKIIEAARIYARNKSGCILWSMGITQHSHGTENVFAIANLVMLTGNIGKPSSGIYPLRGQNNVQGACDMGCLCSLYPGYQPVDNENVKEKFELAWGVQLNSKPGLPLTKIWQAIMEGKVKALYIEGADPVLTVADAGYVKKALESAEFIVCQDIFLNETAKFAHVILPGASFAERDGTFTNTERRIQRFYEAIEPQGEAKQDWQIICELAKRMDAKGFDFSCPSEILQEIASLTPTYGGISYERLEKGSIIWPCPDKDHPGTPILHVEKFRTPDGKGKFTPLSYKPPAEMPDEEYPFILTTDRVLFHFHATLSRKVDGLNRLAQEELLKISPRDAEKLGIKDGDVVRVISRRGEIKVKVSLTEACPEGVVSLTFHFKEAPANLLTNLALDPLSYTPETKVCAVAIKL